MFQAEMPGMLMPDMSGKDHEFPETGGRTTLSRRISLCGVKISAGAFPADGAELEFSNFSKAIRAHSFSKVSIVVNGGSISWLPG